jgi:hypothetical protein
LEYKLSSFIHLCRVHTRRPFYSFTIAKAPENGDKNAVSFCYFPPSKSFQVVLVGQKGSQEEIEIKYLAQVILEKVIPR